ncbi:hypothetical protein MKS88_002032 [Plasmodium brasilianum]|uniref:Uncharacterized protein n=2 Tax=Plasmodium (Plasmodium) TaxID=418103 RepID=A0A1D3JMU3_PLAMA|nr:conserved Plasmodium protein, unknown function [Plasmodium malariae]KAI4839478.1 hypothetical protein MKS88_002032 [Plasmodium brasilianum]SBT87903.1 conserved Plasmodium protein, unknown function [Plasmodium malariae]
MDRKENKAFTTDKANNLSTHQKFDQLIDEYYSNLKDEKTEIKVEINTKTGDHVFKSVERNKADYARFDENDEPPIFSDLVENEKKFGTVKIINPLPKVERRDELKDSYMHWLKTEKLMRPNERRLEHEHMQQKYLETLKLSEDIKKDVKLARVIKSHYPRGIVGVDSIYSENTVLYKEKYDEMTNKREIKERKLKERGEVLEKYNNKNGNFLTFETENK